MQRAAPPASMSGSMRLFHVFGISVFVHWSWLLVAYFIIQTRADAYDSQIWNVLEYLALFVIVLLHEFGHSLACRQVGGKADRILLWPLGGVAFVQPPQRPGPVLWSIAAGPLVNVILLPITIGAYFLSASQGLPDSNPDLHHFLGMVANMNFMLLAFNMLPVYPLDGGQILQSLLWFVIGRKRSLQIVSVLGFIVAICAIGYAIFFAYLWIGIMAVFIAMRSWSGFQQARMLAQIDAAPRFSEAACPSCKEPPLIGPYWGCSNCRSRFDAFANRGTCPHCGTFGSVIPCPLCNNANTIQDWFAEGHRPKSS